jgi:hypothetical protein
MNRILENLIIISGNDVKSQDNVWVISAFRGLIIVIVIIIVVVVTCYMKKVCSSNNGKYMHRFKCQDKNISAIPCNPKLPYAQIY